MLHIPANAALGQALNMQTQPLFVQAIVLGLSAGIFEELARYIVYRFWQTEVRNWRGALFLGLGHGGVEAVITGLLLALTLVNIVIITNAEDPAALGLPEGTLAQVADFWAMDITTPLLAVIERALAITLHLSLSTLVVLCFKKDTLWPLVAAVLWHALADAVAVYTHQTWGILAAEGALLVIAIASVGILRWTRHELQGQSKAEV